MLSKTAREPQPSTAQPYERRRPSPPMSRIYARSARWRHASRRRYIPTAARVPAKMISNARLAGRRRLRAQSRLEWQALRQPRVRAKGIAVKAGAGRRASGARHAARSHVRAARCTLQAVSVSAGTAKSAVGRRSAGCGSKVRKWSKAQAAAYSVVEAASRGTWRRRGSTCMLRTRHSST